MVSCAGVPYCRFPMTPPTHPAFALNTLIEPSSAVSLATPSGFDAGTAYLLASASALAVQLYAQAGIWLTQEMMSSLPPAGGASQYQATNLFNAPEALGFGASATTPGAFTQISIGFAMMALDAAGSPSISSIRPCS